MWSNILLLALIFSTHHRFTTSLNFDITKSKLEKCFINIKSRSWLKLDIQRDSMYEIENKLINCGTRSNFIRSSLGLVTLVPFVDEVQAISRTLDSKKQWDFERGSVELDEYRTQVGRFTLSTPRLLGFGGGGAVFSVEILEENGIKVGYEQDAVLKISWETTVKEIQNECKVLQHLSEMRVPNVETCIENSSFSNGRQAILMQPFFEGDLVSSIEELPSKEAKMNAVQSLITTMVQMLAAGVVTSDLQPLIREKSGELLLVDFSEAAKLPANPDFVDLARVRNFCSEICTSIPNGLQQYAIQVLEKELASPKIEQQKSEDTKLLLDEMLRSLSFEMSAQAEANLRKLVDNTIKTNL
mmetsp:Transcript_39849/g.51374  ORF Transcript_39849/g.51374 Transcript_39849/m.51374 type:complete len:357 (-) Transcript_39849:117-1187(-)